MSLSNTQYEELMHEYSKRRLMSEDAVNARTAEVIKAVPEYKAISDEISSICVAAAKARLKGDDRLINNLHERTNILDMQRMKAMQSAGFPPDYLTPKYICPDCCDTGYTGNRKCHCFLQAEINILYRQSNIKDILARENFDTFDIGLFSDSVSGENGISPRKSMLGALESARNFINKFPSGENLLLFGGPGVGKTFLSNCIAREILNGYHSVVYLSAIELFEYFHPKNDYASYSDGENSGQERYITDCELLIIDDLGTELINSFTNSKLFFCINQRILENRSTIISTNFSLAQLMNTYSERIFSRISSYYTIIRLIGDDLRMRKD